MSSFCVYHQFNAETLPEEDPWVRTLMITKLRTVENVQKAAELLPKEIHNNQPW